MKKTISITLAIIAILAVGCVKASKAVTPSKKTVTITKNFSSFTKIEASSIINIVYKQDQKYSVTIHIPENLVDNFIARQDNNTIKFSLKNAGNIGNANITVSIASPRLKEVELSGASSFTSSSISMASDKIEFDLSGASSLSINNLKAQQVEFDLSGASTASVNEIIAAKSEFDFSGATHGKFKSILTENFNLDLSGASTFNVSDAKVRNRTNVDISGTSSAKLNGITDKLDVETSGCSKADLSDFRANTGTAEASGMSSADLKVKNLTKSKSGMSKISNKK